MRRNMERIISETKVKQKYDINVEEVIKLKNCGSIFNGICDAFVFGYAQGMKAARSEMKKGVNA